MPHDPGQPGLTMLSMYLLGTVVALLMAWLFKKTLLKGEPPMLHTVRGRGYVLRLPNTPQ